LLLQQVLHAHNLNTFTLEASMSYSSAISGMLSTPQEGQQALGHASSATETSTDSHRTESIESVDDAEALTILYERFRRPIYSYTYRLLDNGDDAADVTQEVFLRACISWESLRDRDHLGVWLHHVATNLCVDLIRRRKRLSWWPLTRRKRNAGHAEEVSDDDPLSRLPPDSGGIPEIAEREHIQRVLAAMPEEYALVLVLNVIQGIPYQDIATIVGLSLTVTATRISRAKKMFVEQYRRLGMDGAEIQEKQP
jgi:RNA polymerase sigma-70 factor (ECF subfamily)